MSSSDYSSSSSYTVSTSGEGVASYDKEKGNEFFGMVLKKRYFLVDKIGVGTFSSVWLAVNIENNNIYAIKIQHVDDYEDGKDEAKLLSQCSRSKSQNVPHLIEYFEVCNPKCEYMNMCMVMDLCLGSVKSLCKALPNRKVPFNTALKIISDLCAGIEILNKYQHIHTDIKLSNILINGLNPVFIEFKAFLDQIKFSEDLNEQCKKMYSDYNLDKLEKNKHTNTKIYKDNKRNYANAVKKKFKKANACIIKEFKKICNKYVLPDQQENINKQAPSYYKRNFMFGFDALFLDKKQSQNLTFLLSDLGGAHKIKRTNDSCMQPRAYRAPEVIFECPWGPAIDMWSVGCLFYELLTGEQLFDPNPELDDLASDSDECDNTKHELNIEHLCWIYDLININFKCFEDGKQYKNLCNQNGMLQCLVKNDIIEKSSITEELNKKTQLTNKEKILATTILSKLITEPNKRIKPRDLITLINTFLGIPEPENTNQVQKSSLTNFVDPVTQII